MEICQSPYCLHQGVYPLKRPDGKTGCLQFDTIQNCYPYGSPLTGNYIIHFEENGFIPLVYTTIVYNRPQVSLL